MPKIIAQSRYRNLIDDILKLYQEAQNYVVRFYWETGKRIVEIEQDGAVKAAHGSGLLQKISEELTQRCGEGAGFSIENLRRMRQFYLSHPISPTSAKLTWAQYSELLPVRDKRLRGIDTPELGTPEGERAKKYVQGLLPKGTPIILKSSKTDTHGRFVADVFYLKSSPVGAKQNSLPLVGSLPAGKAGAREGGTSKALGPVESILSDGIYLNQHLLDEGYAVRAEE